MGSTLLHFDAVSYMNILDSEIKADPECVSLNNNIFVETNETKHKVCRTMTAYVSGSNYVRYSIVQSAFYY